MNMNPKRRRLLKPKHRCCHCDCKLDAENSTIEHIIPVSKGGDNSPWNLTLACGPCNHDRSSEDFFLYRQWKRGLEEDIWEGRDFYEGLHLPELDLPEDVEPRPKPIPSVIELMPAAVTGARPSPDAKHKPRRGQRWREIQKARAKEKTIKRQNRGMQSAAMHAMSPHVFDWARDNQ